MEIDFQYFKETQALLVHKTELNFQRFLYEKIDFKQRLIGIIGPRGAGKTTLIFQYLKQNHLQNQGALYLLADHVFFRKGDLLEFAHEFHLKHAGTLLCIDEIHRYPNWNQELKNIYDTLPDLKIIFSGSSSLNLLKGQYDLSRRGILYHLPGLSFREYLNFQKEIKTPAYSLQNILKNHLGFAMNLAVHKSILKDFNDYLRQGYYPFYKEDQDYTLYHNHILNTIDKTIYEDIGSFYNLKTQNLIAFKKILYFLATIPPGEVNINKLAKSLVYNHATISEYLEILNETELIRFLQSGKGGHGLIRKAKKIFLDNPNLAHALGKNAGHDLSTGMTRELFMMNQLQNAGYKPVYSQEGDVQIDKTVIEIGGKNKKFTQIRDVKNRALALDDILIGEKDKIPLYLFGFLY